MRSPKRADRYFADGRGELVVEERPDEERGEEDIHTPKKEDNASDARLSRGEGTYRS